MARLLGTWLLTALLSAITLKAQTQARLTGTVTDNTGAVIVGATVLARNVGTGIASSALTNESGIYSISFLNPGQYELSCEFTGFKKFVRTGLVLETGTTTTINVELQIGELAETVNVSEAAPLLESESGAVGQLIEGAAILNMPIESRRGGALIRMMGNISFNREDSAEVIPRFSMAGGRALNQMWQLDGSVSQNMALGVAQLSLNPPNEALQEFKAESNNYAAEFGRTGGGLILMTTRSGTNAYHGSAYEWLRNEKLNARTFFAPSKAPLRYNIFGAALGGPIRRNKTFFFFNYEGGRRRTGVTVTRNVPQPAEVNGDFSARTDIQVLDPVTRTGSTPATPFPGNIIPQSRMDPIGKAFAAFYPAPNVAGNNPARAPSNNFRANGSDKLTQDFYTTRIDHQLSQKDRLFGRFSWVTAPEFLAAVIPTEAADDRAGPRENRHANALVGWQRTLRPTLIHDFKYMYGNRLHINRGAATGSGLNGKIGLPGVEANTLARVTVTGHAGLGQDTQERVQTPILTQQFTDSLLWIKGNHSIKTGFEFRYSSNKDLFNQSFGGRFDFSDRATNSGLASLLLGWVNQADLVATDLLVSRTDYYGAFVQDDWKVTRKLTLNIGVRWELDTPRWEKQNRQSGFDPRPINPVSGTPGIVTFSGRDGYSKYSHDFDGNNFGPRFGFAYSVNKGLVVRGGYGLSYNGMYQPSVAFVEFQGFARSGTFSSPDGGFTAALPFRSGMPGITRETLAPGFGAVRVGERVRISPDFMARDQVAGYAQQWNLTVQKEMPGHSLLEAAYLANVGHKLSGNNVNINQIPLVNGRGPAVQNQSLRPFPQFGNVTQIGPPWGNSTYHSLNVKFEKRYASGFSFLSNYTWAKFIDDVQANSELGGAQGNGYQSIEARRLDKSLSGSDIRHRLVWSSVYDLPFGKGRRWQPGSRLVDAIAGGWGTGAIFEARSGAPYGVIEQTNRLNTFSESQRPNLLRNPALPSDRSRADLIQQYFDISAFQAPGDGIIGTAPRTDGLGPGFLNFDLSVHKRFAFTEKLGLTFRSDFINLPNQPNFGQPNQLRGNGNFGKIGDILGGATAREIQLGLRLEW